MIAKCGDCDKDAAWVRHTQFAGNHPFCDDHARKEKNFGVDDGYQFWEELKTSDGISLTNIAHPEPSLREKIKWAFKIKHNLNDAALETMEIEIKDPTWLVDLRLKLTAIYVCLMSGHNEAAIKLVQELRDTHDPA